LQGQESWGALATSLRHAEDYGHDPVQTLRDAYAQRELGTAEDIPAVLHWRIEKALEGIDQPVVRVIDREPVDGVPAWIADGRRHQDDLLPAEWRNHLAERHHYIGVRLKERGAVLALEQPAWTQDLGRLPSEPWRMFDWHRTAAEVDVLRTKYRIDPSEPKAIPDKLRGNPIADRLQERVTALHKAAALSTAPEVTVSTREHYATHAAERRATQEAQRKAEREREAAVRDAQRKADREREKAEQQAAREQERAERLAARYPAGDAERPLDAAAVAAETAARAAAATEAIETATDVDAAAIVSNGRDETAAETEAIIADGQDDAGAATTPRGADEIETDEIDYDAFELPDREMLREAGIDPDEESSSSSADTSLTLDMPQTP
jgi:hypothetical protein